VWRSPVAHLLWEQGAAGSNPATPTIPKESRPALEAYGDISRTVWVADSFQGVPRPNARAYPADRGDTLWSRIEPAVSLDTVKTNFAEYGLLDDQEKLLVGFVPRHCTGGADPAPSRDAAARRLV
jgi:hypothetical protein